MAVEKLEAWGQGTERPTLRQAQELARKLRVPLGYLYLSNHPDETLPIPDLRTKSGSPPRKPSPDFLDVAYDALRKQDWYREYLQGEGAGEVPFVRRFTQSSPVGTIAEDVRRTLHLDHALRHSVTSRDDFFNRLTVNAESAGVIVLRSGVVGNNTRRPLDPNEFQGFALSDPIAPLVFVNTRDFKAAQVFTLAHELTHIWMGVSGVSGPDYLAKRSGQPNDDEGIAEAVAAEVLVPSDDFELRWRSDMSVDQNLKELATYYRVSMFVVLKRAYEMEFLDNEKFVKKYEELRKNVHLRRQKGGGGGYEVMLWRNSMAVTNALLVSFLEGTTPSTEASALLNTRNTTLPALASYLGLSKRKNA
jgi:Zn-dependent peptidase ImmA (M78 family)